MLATQGQALRNDAKRRLQCVLLEDKEAERKNQIKNALQIKNDDQIKIANAKAKPFMLQDMTIAKLNEVIPSEEGIPES